MIKRLSFLLFIFLAITACNSALYLAKKKVNSFKRMEWLIGTWEVRTTNYIFEEKWKKIDDTTFLAESIMYFAKDTVFYDEMKIKPNNKYIYLYSKSKINTSGTMNIYKLTKITKNKIVFENTSNKEQQSITYLQKSPNIMTILVKGKELSVESYDMNKVVK